jgi:hypothetical protein
MLEFVFQVVSIIVASAILVTWMIIPTDEEKNRELFNKSDLEYRDGDNT